MSAMSGAETDSSPVDPGLSSPESSTPAAATAPLTPEGTDPVPASLPGPIPYDRHQAILDNQRRQARDEALAEWRQQYGWAERVPQAQLQQAIQWAQRFGADPAGFLSESQAELLAHPEHGAKLRSWAARILGGKHAPALESEPGPDLVDPTTGTQLYSAGQLAKREAWREQQLAEKVNALIAPIQQREQQRAAQEAHAQRAEQAQEWSKTLYTEAQSWPRFEELRPHILARLRATPPAPNEDPGEVGRRFATAYITEFQSRVLPTLAQQEQASVLANLKTKALASTTNPAMPAASTPKRPTSMEEAFGMFGVGR